MKAVLIIEDDVDQAALCARVLSAREFQPIVAGTIAEGLAQALARRFDLIVLDLKLPDGDGFQLCRRLREERRTRTTPIVMVTALRDAASRRRGLRVGADAYVSKPYAAAELELAVEEALAWRKALRREGLLGEIRLELDNDFEVLREADAFVADVCRDTPLTEEQARQLRHALMEMGQNAIEWGNRGSAEHPVEVVVRMRSDAVEIRVRDQGVGFDPGHVPHAATPDDPIAHMEVREQLGLRDGGFGLMIARGLLDELKHNERGNEVTLVKRYSARLDPDRN